MSDKALVLDNVVKQFGDVTAVAGVSLEVDHGEFVAFIGTSGCGKTTTLRLIAGLETPTSGTILAALATRQPDTVVDAMRGHVMAGRERLLLAIKLDAATAAD